LKLYAEPLDADAGRELGATTTDVRTNANARVSATLNPLEAIHCLLNGARDNATRVM